ncbi:hypothetical protein NC653_012436 [Populus alba x Populus x berolinensis]|uniref:Uncharacterized protein n=1 Tax=Populus alba x Populus x berolinensis TaxID=444605 RepID=A0AAD6W7R4_9ROSI|nr:hypothetical protein NC653_012436 [Populus alba x Populus x berolinensis]
MLFSFFGIFSSTIWACYLLRVAHHLILLICICLSLTRPALPSQLKPPMGVHLFVPSICSDGAAWQLCFCHPWSDSQVFLLA